MSQILNAKLSQRFDKRDKNQNNFLILKTDNDDTIFVFPRNVNEERWSWLVSDKDYHFNFTVEKSVKNETDWVLLDYTIDVSHFGQSKK